MIRVRGGVLLNYEVLFLHFRLTHLLLQFRSQLHQSSYSAPSRAFEKVEHIAAPLLLYCELPYLKRFRALFGMTENLSRVRDRFFPEYAVLAFLCLSGLYSHILREGSRR